MSKEHTSPTYKEDLLCGMHMAGMTNAVGARFYTLNAEEGSLYTEGPRNGSNFVGKGLLTDWAKIGRMIVEACQEQGVDPWNPYNEGQT